MRYKPGSIGWSCRDWSPNDQSFIDYSHHERTGGRYSQEQTCKEESFERSEIKAMLQQLLQNQQQAELELKAKLYRVYNDINSKYEEVCTPIEERKTKTVDDAEVTPTIDYNSEVDEIAKLVFSDESEYENWIASVRVQEQTQGQLKGTCDLTLEIDDFEEVSLPCTEKVVSREHILIDECLDLSCESQDKVDYSLVNSTGFEIDFIFPSNAFDPPSSLSFKEYLRKYFSTVVACFDDVPDLLLWAIAFLFGYIVYCENRRRTKGALAQPFDSYD